MKKFYFLQLLAAIMLFASCKRDNFATPEVTGIGTDTLVLNIGDKKILAPNITNLRGNNYTWLVNGKEVATGQLNYTFEATAAGNFEVTFKANNKAGTNQQSYRIFVEKLISASIAEQPEISMCNVVEIIPAISGPDRNDYTYEWSIGDSVIGKKRNLNFISPIPGTYELKLRTTAGKQTSLATRSVTIKAEDYVKNACTVLEFLPSPGKTHNWSIIGYAASWQYGQEFPLAYNDFLAKATELRKSSVGIGLFIGGWGSSATFKFDHTVVNAPGKPDVEVTAIYSRLDIPIVSVAYDKNKNGQPDADEWYVIKNDDFGLEDLPEYQITFTYNKTETDDRRIYTYFNWKDNQEPAIEGEVATNKIMTSSITSAGTFSTRNFFPGYYMPDQTTKQVVLMNGWSNTIVRKGKRITRNMTGAVQFQQKLNIDIDLAVNAKGEPVQLPGIDFIKVQKLIYPTQLDTGTGLMRDMNLEEGRMTQVFGILDRHIK